ncbi:hypothetical protein LG275_13915 (plasmid) [Chryseomicrobium palamuruense]
MRYLVRSINEDIISEGDKEVIFEDREVAEKKAHELNLLTEHTWKVIPLSDDFEKDI